MDIKQRVSWKIVIVLAIIFFLLAFLGKTSSFELFYTISPLLTLLGLIFLGWGIVGVVRKNPPAENKNNTEFRYPVFASLWIWWIALTAAYLIIYILSNNLCPGQPLSLFGAWIGLFVPFGFYNAIAFGFITIPIFILIIYFLEKWALKLHASVIWKVIFNILILFIFTILVDLLIWHSWMSLTLVQQGGLRPAYSCSDYQ